jgi:hypothetical protein
MRLRIVDYSASAVRSGDVQKMWTLQGELYSSLVPDANRICVSWLFKCHATVAVDLASTAAYVQSEISIRNHRSFFAFSFAHVRCLCIPPVVFLPCTVQPLPEPVCVCACVCARACVCICCWIVLVFSSLSVAVLLFREAYSVPLICRHMLDKLLLHLSLVALSGVAVLRCFRGSTFLGWHAFFMPY